MNGQVDLALEHAAAVERSAAQRRLADDKSERERISRFTAALGSQGFTITEALDSQPRAHAFQPYPTPGVTSCLVCPYPKAHPVHKAP